MQVGYKINIQVEYKMNIQVDRWLRRGGSLIWNSSLLREIIIVTNVEQQMLCVYCFLIKRKKLLTRSNIYSIRKLRLNAKEEETRT